MSYLLVNDFDCSKLVNSLKVDTEAKYNAQQNAAGNTVIDYINSKKVVEVGFIPMNDADCASIFSNMQDIVVNLSYLNPKSNEIESGAFLCPSDSVEYYTIQAENVMLKAFTLKFSEL